MKESADIEYREIGFSGDTATDRVNSGLLVGMVEHGHAERPGWNSGPLLRVRTPSGRDGGRRRLIEPTSTDEEHGDE